MACDLIPHTYLKTRVGTSSEAITKAFREVSALIFSRASANRDFQGMGTTCSATLLQPQRCSRTMGDSSHRMLAAGSMLTFVPSLVWELVRRNHLTSEQANLSVPENVITRSLGPGSRYRSRHRGAARRSGSAMSTSSVPAGSPVSSKTRDRRVRGELPSPGRLSVSDQPRQSARRAEQHHGSDRPHRPLDRSRLGGSPGAATGRARRSGRSRRPGLAAGHDLIKSRRRTPSIPRPGTIPPNGRCPIDDALIDCLEDLTRRTQEQAIAQAWSLDWTAVASLRREAADARSANNRWVSLRKLGEIITLLGEAARYFRKSTGPTPVQ